MKLFKIQLIHLLMEMDV